MSGDDPDAVAPGVALVVGAEVGLAVDSFSAASAVGDLVIIDADMLIVGDAVLSWFNVVATEGKTVGISVEFALTLVGEVVVCESTEVGDSVADRSNVTALVEEIVGAILDGDSSVGEMVGSPPSGFVSTGEFDPGGRRSSMGRVGVGVADTSLGARVGPRLGSNVTFEGLVGAKTGAMVGGGVSGFWTETGTETGTGAGGNAHSQRCSHQFNFFFLLPLPLGAGASSLESSFLESLSLLLPTEPGERVGCRAGRKVGGGGEF